MFTELLSIIVLSTVTVEAQAPHYVSCDGFPDGFHEAACWGKVTCVNGQPEVMRCEDNEMYDLVTDSCVSLTATSATTSCNVPVDCTHQTDGRHADYSDGCRSYYICMEGAFFGRFYCPPGDLKFNEILQVCDYYGNAPPPCGTHQGPYSVTPAGPWPEYTNPV